MYESLLADTHRAKGQITININVFISTTNVCQGASALFEKK